MNEQGIYLTPGFIALNQTAQAAFMDKALYILSTTPINFVVGDPNTTEQIQEDQGRTAHISFQENQKVYCKKDFYPDKTLITFFLASEY